MRADGGQEDWVTGNLVYYAVEHVETRPVEDESLPEDGVLIWSNLPQLIYFAKLSPVYAWTDSRR